MTPTELQTLAEHVQYEVNEFRNALRKIESLAESDAALSG
jgi:hypothetical protein